MRIIGGTLKGKKLIAPSNLPARPTTDFAREALFNILKHKINLSGIHALDLFGGLGGISFELVSRGVKTLIYVDIHPGCVAFVKQSAKHFNTENIIPVKANVWNYLKKTKQKFDFIFADPPYDLAQIEQLPNAVFEADCLSEGAIFVLEHSERVDFSSHPRFTEHRKYGAVHFSFFL